MKARLAVLLVALFSFGLVSSAQAESPSFSATKSMKNLTSFVNKLQAKRGTAISTKTRSSFRSKLKSFRNKAIKTANNRFADRKKKNANRIRKKIKRDTNGEKTRLVNEVRVVVQGYKEQFTGNRHDFSAAKRDLIEEWSERIAPVKLRLRKTSKRKSGLRKRLKKRIRTRVKKRRKLVKEAYETFQIERGRIAAEQSLEIGEMKADSKGRIADIRHSWWAVHKNHTEQFADTRSRERGRVHVLYSRGTDHIQSMSRKKSRRNV